jgi:predicted nuclease of restriction endonuclease-like (RecB) superfamily
MDPRQYNKFPIQRRTSGLAPRFFIISDKDKRIFYEQECINSAWSVRELKRQIETSLFERLLLSKGKTNKETVLVLSRQGIAISRPEDILKDLGGLENTIFASRYVYYIPDKQQLIAEVKALLESEVHN